MNTNQYDVMLVDPSTPAGEDALALSEPGRRIVMLLMLAGPASAALARRASADGTSVVTAADAYLTGLSERATARGLSVKEWVKVVGADTVGAVAQLVGELPGSRVLLPSDTRAVDPAGLDQLADRLGADVLVAPPRGAECEERSPPPPG